MSTAEGGESTDLISVFDLFLNRHNKLIHWAHRSVVTRKTAESTMLRRWMERIFFAWHKRGPARPSMGAGPRDDTMRRQSYILTALATLASAAISAGARELSPSVRWTPPRLRGACDEIRRRGPPRSPHRTAQIVPRSIGRYGEIRSHDAGLRNCMGFFFPSDLWLESTRRETQRDKSSRPFPRRVVLQSTRPRRGYPHIQTVRAM